MTVKQLQDFIKQGESQSIELKQAASSAKDLAREIAAFANTCGGTLIMGVNDSGRIIGVRDLKAAEQMITNALNHNCRPPVQEFFSNRRFSFKCPR